MSRRDLGESLIRRPTTARPAARAADTFQIPAAAQPPAGATHRTTVTYPAPLLLGLKTAALNNRGTLGELVRAAIAAALTTPIASPPRPPRINESRGHAPPWTSQPSNTDG